MLNSIGVPPAARMPSLTCTASSRRWKLHGPISIHVLATPMSGFFRSASVKPTAFSIARAGARRGPVVSGLAIAHDTTSNGSGSRAAPAASSSAYEPSVRSIGANSARCASARAQVQVVARRREVGVEQVFPRAAGNRPRLELRQIDAAQRKHAERLEQRARLVRQREHDRRLVGDRVADSGARPMTRKRVMLSSKSWIDEASGVRPKTSPARADAIAAASVDPASATILALPAVS